MMFDGAAVPTAAATLDPDLVDKAVMAAPPPDAGPADHAGQSHAGDVAHERYWRSFDDTSVDTAAQDIGGGDPARSVIFIDSSVSGYAQLAQEWSDRGQVIIIDAARDGVEQMLGALAGRSNLDAIHIVSHGTADAVQLGTTRIDQATVQGNLAQSLSAIGARLAADGDILLYGCSVGGGDAGNGLLTALGSVTGADIAASDDLTGAAARGGDWDLEVRSGAVEATPLHSERFAETLQLSPPTTAWTISGNSGSTVIEGVTVTITFSGAFNAPTQDTLNNIAAFVGGAQGSPDLAAGYNTGSLPLVSGTITITFSEAVTNPILNVDRLGGVSAGLSNSALLTLTSGGSLTKLSGGNHLVVTGTTITRQVGQATANNGESSLDGTLGTAAGSIQVNGTFTTLTFSVTGLSGDTFEVSASADRSPTAQNDAFVTNRGASLSGNLLVNNGSGADADVSGDALTVTRVNGNTFTVGQAIALSNGTLTITNATTGDFTFVPNGAYPAGPQTFTYTIADPNGGTSTATVTITVNDPPVVALGPTNLVSNASFETTGSWTTNQGAVEYQTTATAGFGVPSPPDGTRFAEVEGDAGGRYIEQTITTVAGQQYAYSLQATTRSSLNVSDKGSLWVNGVKILDFTTGNQWQSYLATFTATGTSTVIRIQSEGSVSGQFPGNADSGGLIVDDVQVRSINNTIAYSENGAATNITATGDRIYDFDSTNTASASVTLTNPQAGDRLLVNGSAAASGTIGAISWTRTDTAVTFTGSATRAQYEAAIRQVQFENTGDNPGTTPRTITVTTSDGALTSNAATVTVNVTAINDAPVNTLPAGGYTIAEDSGPLSLTGLSVTDVDAGTGPITVTLSIPAGSGTLAAASGSGVTVSGSGTSSLVLSGTLANINAYLASAARPAYTQVGDFHGTVTLTMVTSDGGNTGTGGALSDTDTTTITITTVADIVADAVSTNEDSALTFSPLANDSFENAAPQITAIGGQAIAIGQTVTVPNGTVTLNTGNVLVFTPAANFNGTSTFSYTVTSGGVTETANIVVTINAVNDAPSGTDAVLTGTEDTPRPFTAADFGFSDVEGNAFAGVVITSLPANGTLTLNGSAVTAGTFVTAAQIAAGQLVWTPATDANGNGLGSFTFQVRDNGGVANGGTDTDPTPNTIAFNVAAVNDAPVLGPATQTVGYVENAAPSALFDASTTLTDVDNANMAGATITLGNAQSGDRLLVNGSAAASGTIGTISWTRTDTLVTFSGTATNAQYAAALRLVQFENTSDNPGSANRTVTATVTDGALSSAAVTRTVAVTPVNDPIVNTLPASYTMAEDGTLVLSGLSVADSDAGTGQITVRLTVPAGIGTITAASGGGVVVTGSGTNDLLLTGTLANINAYLGTAASQPVFRQAIADFNGTVTLTMTSNDGGNTGGAATADTDAVTIAITPVADIVADTVNAAEDTAVTFSPLANDSFENGNPQITAIGGQAISQGQTLSVANGTVTLGANNVLTFTPAANFSGSSGFTYTVTSGGVTETASVTMVVSAVNDTPTLIVPTTIAGTEDTPLAITGISFTDVDAGSSPVLVVLSAASGSLTWGASAGVTATQSGPGTVILSGSIASINSAIAAGRLTYTPVANANGAVTLTTTINDQGNTGTDPGLSGDAGSEEATATTTIQIAPVDDAPDANDDSFAATENTPVTFSVLGNDTDIDSPALTITQINGQAIALGGSVAITGGSIRLNADGTLTYTPTTGYSGATSFTYTVSDGTLTDTATVFGVVGAINHAPQGTDTSVAAREDAPQTITAANFGFSDIDGNAFVGVRITTLPANGALTLSGVAVTAGQVVTRADVDAGRLVWTPAANANGSGLGAFTFQVQDNGGTANGGVDIDQSPNTMSFNVAAVNDAPSGTDATLSATEDTPYVFAAANFGFSDPVEGNAFAGVVITTLPANGSLTLNGVAVAANQFIVAADITAGRLIWTPAANANGNGLGQFTFQVRDNGGTANNGVDTDQTPNTLRFNVAAVNDAPVAVADSFTTAEDTATIIDVRANDTDVDAGAVLSVTAVNGTAITVGGPGVAVTGGTVTLNAAGQLVFTPTANFNGPVSFSYTIRDDAGATASGSVTGSVTPVADPVVNVVPPAQSGAEDTALVFNTTNGNALTVSNPDGGTMTVTISVQHGTLTLSGTSGLSFGAGDGINDAAMTFTGTSADINAALAGLTYRPTADYNGTDQIAITSTRTADGASDSDTIALMLAPVADAVADSVTTAEDTALTFNVLTGAGGASPDNFEDAGRVLSAVTQPAQGSVTFSADGTVIYTPPANFSGTTSFAYTVTAGGVTETQTVTVTVTAVNDAPVLDLDASGAGTGYATSYTENGAGVPVVDTDVSITDVDSATLSSAVVRITNGSAGDVLSTTGLPAGITASYDAATFTLTLSGSASPATYQTALAAVGFSSTSENPATTTRSIDVSVSDGQLSSNTATASVTVTRVNDAPQGANATLSAVEDTPYAFRVADFGFSDPAEGDAFAGVVITTLPANGTMRLNGTTIAAGTFVSAADIAAGRLTWQAVPDARGNGLGQFTFQVRDTGGTANGGVDTDPTPNTIAFNVSNVNDAPVSSDGTATTTEDTPVSGQLPGYTDADGDTATYRAGTTVPAFGSVTINPNGSYTYTPGANFNGTDRFSFVVDDGNGGTVERSITVTVTPVNDPPVLDSEIPDRSRPDGASVSFDVSTFFSDRADGDALTFTVTGLPAGLTLTNGVISGTIDRNASIGGPSSNGVYSVTVTASDGRGGTVSDTFVFTVTNPAPTARNDTVAVSEDGSVTFNPITGMGTSSGATGADSDPDGDTLVVVSVAGQAIAVGGTVAVPNGTITLNGNGSLTFTPAANFNGSTTFTYAISDGNGGTAQALITVNVAGQNDAPQGNPIADQTRNDGSTVDFDAGSQFSDVDGDTLTFSATGLPPGLTINPATGRITGTIAGDASGPTGSRDYAVTITALDGNGGRADVTFRYTVLNLAPNAEDDSATTAEDTPVDIAILANDSDADGDTVAIVRVNNQPITIGGAPVVVANGTVELINDAGTLKLRYVPAENYNGTDSFTYTIDDGNGGIDTATVSVNVTPANDQPVATTVPDRVRADGQSFNYDMGAYFSDPDGDSLRYVVTGLPAGLSYNPTTGIISGVLDSNASRGGPNGDGIYQITVTATDRADGSGLTQTQSFQLTATDPYPNAAADAVSVAEDTTVVIPVLQNDSDPDGDPLTVVSASAGKGTVTINLDGSLTYTPPADYNGPDTITYTISDGNGGSSTGQVTITVTPVNDGPTSSPIPELSGNDNAPVDFDAGAYFQDVDAGDDLTFAVTAGALPPGVTLDPATGLISGTLANTASLGTPYSITITATDGSGNTTSQTITWNVSNRDPVAYNDSATVGQNQTGSGNVLDNDVDPDNDGKLVVNVNGSTAPGTPVAGTSGGTFIINADGTYSFDPGTAFDDLAVGETRTTSIVYQMTDTDDGYSSATLTVTVVGTNDAPTATTLPEVTHADGQVLTAAEAIDLSAYFSDADGDSMTFAATGLPTGLFMDASGRITGTIPSDASVGSPYTVTVTATDSNGATFSTNFVYTITNPDPIAVNDSASTDEDTAIDIDVLDNDFDPDGDTVIFDPDFPPQAANGTVTINPDGTLRYVPNLDYNGIDTIVYRIVDGQGGISSGVVNVSVADANDDPTSTDIPDIDRRDGDQIVLDASAYFSDSDGDDLTYQITGLPPGLTYDPQTGQITGQIDAGASGPTGRRDYTIVITADDGRGGTATEQFTLTAINVAPTATDDTATTNEDTAVTIPVLSNDTDGDGDSLSIIRVNNTVLLPGGSVTTADGTVSIVIEAGVQKLAFTPRADFNGNTAFTYTVGDGNGGFDDGVVNISVTAVNDAPVASTPLPDRTRPDGATVSFPVEVYFSDVDGDNLDYEITGLPAGLTYDPATGLISGTVASNASQGGSGGVYTVSVTAIDPSGARVTQSFVFRATNPGPTAANDTVQVAEDGSVTFDPITGAGTVSGAAGADIDPDGDPLRVVTVDGGKPISPGGTVTLANGTLAMNADGSLTFTPNANFNGPTTITYTVSDSDGATAQAVITINTTAVNDAPSLDLNGAAAGSGNSATFTEGDAPVLIAPDAVAFDAEEQIVSLDVTLGGFVDGAQEVIRLNSQVELRVGTAGSGTVTFGNTVFRYSYDGANALHIENAAGAATPMPAASVSALIHALQYENTSSDPTGGARTFQFTATDSEGATAAPAVATVTVGTVNSGPIGTPIASQSGNDADSVTFDVSGFFSDADSPSLAYTATGLPPGLTIDTATGVISGTIASDASRGGTYLVTVTASDGTLSAAQQFTWVVANPAPSAVDDTASGTENQILTGDVTPGSPGQDFDPDGDPIVVSAVNGIAGNVGTTAAGSAGGAFVVGADGLWRFDPGTDFDSLGAGQIATTSLTYTISDGQGGTSVATLTVTVTGTNDAPFATSLSPVSASDGAAVAISTAGAFSDADAGDVLQYDATGLPAGLTIDAATGEITGTLERDASRTGPYWIIVSATDSQGAQVSTMLVLNVSNPPPTAGNGTVTTAEDTPFSGSLAASDPDGDPLSYSLVTAPQNGLLTLAPDGTYTYTPAADYNGTDSFTYLVDDGNGGTVQATVTITVTAVNDRPVTADDSFTTQQGAPVTFDVRANDTDAEGSALTVTAIDNQAITVNGSVTVVGGTVTLNADGTLTFAPARDYSGTPSFTYTISDGNLTASGSVNGQVIQGNGNPVVPSGPVTTPEDTVLVSHVGASDPNQDTLTYSLVSGVSSGTLTFNADGSYTYTPNANFNGSDSFVVLVTDDQGGQTQATIQIVVTAVNDAPVASAPAATAIEDTAVVGQITASDVDGDTLTYAVQIQPASGTLTLGANGSYTYTPNANFNGSDSFTIAVSDGNGGVTLVTVPVTVDAVNDAPVASAPPVTAAENTTVTGQIAASDADGDVLSYTVQSGPANGTLVLGQNGSYSYTPNLNFIGSDSFTIAVSDGNGGVTLVTVPITITDGPVNQAPIASAPPASTAEDSAVAGQITASDPDGGTLSYAVQIQPANGTLTLGANGSYTYTPNLNFNGSDSFTIAVSDGQGGVTFVTVPVTVAAVNDAPVVSAAPASVTEDTPFTGQIAASDVEGDALSYAIQTPPTNGILTVGANGSYTYTPNANFNGSDSFTIAVSDGQGGTTLVTVPVSVAAVNDAPVVSVTPPVVVEDAPFTGQINASDADGDPLSYTVQTQPAHGTLTLGADGSYTYTPNLNFSGSDSFTIAVSDGRGGVTVVTVPLTVAATNDAPVVSVTPPAVVEDTPFTGQIVASDAEGDPLSYTVQTQPAHGTLTLGANGSYTYTPNADFSGSDSFTIAVSDGRGGVTVVTVPFTVAAVNDVPTASAPPVVAVEDTVVSGQINASDADGDPLTFSVQTPPANGTLALNATGGYTYTPRANFHGSDSFVIAVSDGKGGVTLVTVPVSIAAVNDAPVDGPETISSPSNDTVTIDVLANASDADGDTLSVISASASVGEVIINPDGTITFTPPADFIGTVTITYVVSDGNGGLVESTATLDIGSGGTDMTALLQGDPFAQGNAGRLTESRILIRALDERELRAPLIITDAVNGVRSLNGTADLGGHMPVGSAVNAIRSLNGTAALSDGRPIEAVTDIIGRRTVLRSEIERLFDNRFDPFAVETRTGFSLRPSSLQSGQIAIESIVRDATLYLEVTDTRQDDKAHIVEFQARTTDGTPLPEWVRVDGRGLVAVEPPIGTETLRLVIVGIRADGSRVELPIVVEAETGEIQRDEEASHKTGREPERGASAAGRTMPLSAMLAKGQAAMAAETSRLLGAFNE